MPSPVTEDTKLVLESVEINALLTVPHQAKGMILFAHGSGSGRYSPRNQYIAQVMNNAGYATLLMDLLTEKEDETDRYTGEYRFDIELLANRMLEATDWVRGQPSDFEVLPVGYFGASTGAGAALIAASQRNDVKAVVSRGGRPDLADKALPSVTAPTVLIVGGNDHEVIKLNQSALARLTCTKQLEIVPGATHLFEEAGTLEVVAKLATDWFRSYLK
ncbi:dienelactone hydrolase family domain-containing protein [Ditylenchus destructor]|nr:dienelactone hydrolase family domain-containing protein [Ditylenchus destructor]